VTIGALPPVPVLVGAWGQPCAAARLSRLGGDRGIRLFVFLRFARRLASPPDDRRTLWIAYGVIISASPVVVASVLIFFDAAWTTLRTRRDAVHKAKA
jgi:hypothetical protein